MRAGCGKVDHLAPCPPSNPPPPAGGIAYTARPGAVTLWQLAVHPALPSLIRTVASAGTSGKGESQGRVSWPIAGIGRILSPRSIAEFDNGQDWDMGEPGSESPEGGRDPHTRSAGAGVHVLDAGELAEERAAARRAIRRLHLVPVWYESGARPHPPRSMYRAYLEQSQVFIGTPVCGTPPTAG